MGLKVAKPLRQPAVLVKRHHLVGAPDAVKDVHVAGRGPNWWWRLDASDRGSGRHPAEGPRRGDGRERGDEHTPPDPHHRTTSDEPPRRRSRSARPAPMVAKPGDATRWRSTKCPSGRTEKG